VPDGQVAPGAGIFGRAPVAICRFVGSLPDGQWYAVRCIFRHRFLEDLESADATIYEERITLWRAPSVDHAIELAEDEAASYAAVMDARVMDAGDEYLGLAQAYELVDDPGHGSEVFSLLRESELDAEAYLDTFFDTGTERQQRNPS
jgi:hypothetical protein